MHPAEKEAEDLIKEIIGRQKSAAARHYWIKGAVAATVFWNIVWLLMR